MSIIAIEEIAFARLQSPDLDVAEQFLTDFGLVRVERTAAALYMRGTDPAHHLHVTHLGPPKVLGIAYRAASENDLHTLARLAPGSSPVEDLHEPGGGKRVRLCDPNGFPIEVVHGITELAPIAIARSPVNSGSEPHARAGTLMRPPRGAAAVKRLGHAVFITPNVAETVGWFRDVLGVRRSDDVYAGVPENVIGSFNRLDRGDAYVDHHVLFCMTGEPAGLNHIAFEVADIDDVFMGHAYLRSAGRYTLTWGVGRHTLGSQVFDYWSDPWGRVHEHWADSDRLNASTPGNLVSADEGLPSQWGDDPPEAFKEHASV